MQSPRAPARYSQGVQEVPEGQAGLGVQRVPGGCYDLGAQPPPPPRGEGTSYFQREASRIVSLGGCSQLCLPPPALS